MATSRSFHWRYINKAIRPYLTFITRNLKSITLILSLVICIYDYRKLTHKGEVGNEWLNLILNPSKKARRWVHFKFFVSDDDDDDDKRVRRENHTSPSNRSNDFCVEICVQIRENKGSNCDNFCFQDAIQEQI